MARIAAARTRNPIVRFSYWFGRRRTKKDMTPLGIRGHHPWLLMGFGNFELTLERAKRVPPLLKYLAGTKVAVMVGCTW